MERIKKGAELAAWRHGFQAGELTIASLCPYSTGSILAKAWHEGYQKARDEHSDQVLKWSQMRAKRRAYLSSLM